MTRSFRWALLPLMLFFALSLPGISNADHNAEHDKNSLSSINGDNTKVVEVRDINGTLVLSGGIMIVDSDDDDDNDGDFYSIELEGTGMDGSNPDGQFDLAVEREDGIITGLEMDVDVEDLAPNATYGLFLDGSKVGSFTTDSAGNGEIDLDVGDTAEFRDMDDQ